MDYGALEIIHEASVPQNKPIIINAITLKMMTNRERSLATKVQKMLLLTLLRNEKSIKAS